VNRSCPLYRLQKHQARCPGVVMRRVSSSKGHKEWIAFNESDSGDLNIWKRSLRRRETPVRWDKLRWYVRFCRTIHKILNTFNGAPHWPTSPSLRIPSSSIPLWHHRATLSPSRNRANCSSRCVGEQKPSCRRPNFACFLASPLRRPRHVPSDLHCVDEVCQLEVLARVVDRVPDQ